MVLSYDNWLIEGCDMGLDNGTVPCEDCGVPYEDHRDEELGHAYSLPEPEPGSPAWNRIRKGF